MLSPDLNGFSLECFSRRPRFSVFVERFPSSLAAFLHNTADSELFSVLVFSFMGFASFIAASNKNSFFVPQFLVWIWIEFEYFLNVWNTRRTPDGTAV